MAVNLKTVESLYKELKSDWSKKPKDLKRCSQLLDNLKISLTQLSFLPTGEAKFSRAELAIARDVLEIAVEYSVVSKDVAAFERYMTQLKCYYFDYKPHLGESENMYKLLGLNLLFLLSMNHVSEFHTELEMLSADIIQNNKFIRPILALEQYIMEGRYNKIFAAKSSAPSEIYSYFMDELLETVRDEIAACIEKSYEKISASQSAKKLNLKTLEEMKAFGDKRDWNLTNDGFYNFVNKSKKPRETLPSLALAEQVIFYARELEMIV